MNDFRWINRLKKYLRYNMSIFFLLVYPALEQETDNHFGGRYVIRCVLHKPSTSSKPLSILSSLPPQHHHHQYPINQHHLANYLFIATIAPLIFINYSTNIIVHHLHYNHLSASVSGHILNVDFFILVTIVNTWRVV